jgi:anaerobic selenocysteine-containing dehydrogenase
MSDGVRVVSALCRICINACGLTVTLDEAGRARHVTGDRNHPAHAGYSCVKGRNQPAYLNSPTRRLRPEARDADGTLKQVSSAQALDEIASALQAILKRHGPEAIANYVGTYRDVLTVPFAEAFMDALGSPMRFDPNTIDKPGKLIAQALHGKWNAPPTGFHDARVALVVGANPLVGHTGFPHTNPRKWLDDARRAGMTVIVVDPRRTDIARRSDIYLQPRPGHDVAIVAAMIRVVLVEGLQDREFLAREVRGVEALAEAVAPFTPEAVAEVADVEAAQIVSAARAFASAGRGFAFAGTGANMSQSGTLLEYLLLALQTLCGYWMREGDQVRNVPTLMSAPSFTAQASAPRPARGYGVRLARRGLTSTPAGLPTTGVADEILSGRIKALVITGGNPVAGWPDQLRVIQAMEALELLVVIDPWETATTRYAHYVLPPPMPLEAASTTAGLDGRIASGMPGYGVIEAYAQYSPAVVTRPPGSDLLEDWEVYYELAKRLGRRLRVVPSATMTGPVGSSGTGDVQVVEPDPARRPTTDELLAAMAAGSRVPLDEVKRHPSGALFPARDVVVGPKQAGWAERLHVGDAEMMADLAGLLPTPGEMADKDAAYPMQLISRRLKHVFNSTATHLPAGRGEVTYNPAFMHPLDLERLGLRDGDVVSITSARSAIPAVVASDDTLRPGLVSMAHSYGGAPDRDTEFRERGSSTGRLIDQYTDYDRYSGQPRMSAIRVCVEGQRGDVMAHASSSQAPDRKG